MHKVGTWNIATQSDYQILHKSDRSKDMCQKAITSLFKTTQIGILAIQEATDIFLHNQDNLSEDSNIGHVYNRNGVGLLWDQSKYTVIADSLEVEATHVTADFIHLETREVISMTSAHIFSYDLLHFTKEPSEKVLSDTEVLCGSLKPTKKIVRDITTKGRSYKISANIVGADTNSIPELNDKIHSVFTDAQLRYTALGQPTNYHEQSGDTDHKLVERELDYIFADSKPQNIRSHFELNRSENPSDHIAVIADVQSTSFPATRVIASICNFISTWFFAETSQKEHNDLNQLYQLTTTNGATLTRWGEWRQWLSPSSKLL